MLLKGCRMNSRISWLALAVFVVGCGTGPEEHERNRNPVTFCAGLDRNACNAASECYVEPLACITLCVDDGQGNCTSPCATDFRCLARPVSCEQLSEQQCVADSRCEFVQYACDAMCRDDGHGGCLPCNVPPSQCRTRTPATCESLNQQQCAVDPRCEVVNYACTLECRDDGHGGCLPCNAPPASCRTRQPTSCEQLNAQQCSVDSRCELIDWACTAECRDDGHGGCLPCVPPGPVCRTRQVNPVACTGLDAQTCATNPRCELQPVYCTLECRDDGHGGCLPCDPAVVCVERTATQCYGLSIEQCSVTPGCELLTPVCNCAPDSPACDCAAIAPTCVPSTTPVSCYGLPPQVCAQHPECEFVSRDVCDCAGPNCACPVIEPSCQPRSEPPVLCFGLDPQACAVNAGCEWVQRTCGPNEDCAFDGYCGPRSPVEVCEGLDPQVCVNTPGCGLLEADCFCPPNAACDCTAPAPRCVSTVEPQPNPCVGLDLAQCSLDSRCEIGSLVCTTECRDDGNGGCLPCPDTAVCQLRDEGPVVGCGGTPPPSP